MKTYRTRKDQLGDLIKELYTDNKLPKSLKAKIRKFGRDCMMIGAAEERHRTLNILNESKNYETVENIQAASVLSVLGFE